MLIERLKQELHTQHTKQLYRTVDIRESSQGVKVIYKGKPYLSFCSNDYLGLANHPDAIKAFKIATDHYGVGSAASHVLTGHCEIHHALEEEVAEFLAYPAALIFSTGYMANIGAITTFAKRGDLLIQDHRNHASLIDAGLLARAEMRRFRHNDMQHLEKILQSTSHNNKFIVTQGIFSMSGELAPLPEIVQLAKSHKAWLMLDDAHGLGCLGATGRGTLEHFQLTYKDVPILIGTFGKAFGSFGAFIAGDHAFIETLRQFARTYIYTTALPPAVCAATRATLAIAQKETWRQLHLKTLITEFRRDASKFDLNILPSVSAIQAIEIGDERKALELSEQLFKRGILIKAIRCPTVAFGHACLRINLSANHSSQDIAFLVENLRELIPK